MANTDLFIDTVKRMVDAGLEEKAILAALDDLGLTEDEKKDLLAKVTGKSEEKTSEPKKSKLVKEKVESKSKPSIQSSIELFEEHHEKIAEKTSQKIKEHLDEREAYRDFQDSSAHIAIDKQSELIEELVSSMKTLQKDLEVVSKKTVSSSPLNVDELISKMNELEAKISTLKAEHAALQTLLKQILDVNRQILTKL